MKSNRYTIHIVSDNVDTQKRFSISRFWLHALLFLIALIIISIGGVLIYYIPQIDEFSKKNQQFEKMVAERTHVMELYRDLNRLGQMEEIIRSNLSIVNDDKQSSSIEKTSSFVISYIENIPSQAPVDGFLTQRMLDKSHFWQKNHYGIDIAVQEGEPVLASAGGRVIFSGWTYDLGNLIIIYHGDDYFTHYGHNQLNLFENHGLVKRGDVIALAGSTGISSGPHLHFEIWKDSDAIDPLVFFPEYKERDISIEKND